MIKVVKLSKYNIQPASAIADSVFRDSPDIPSEGFKASLSRKALLNYNTLHKKEILSLEYFVAMEVETRRIMGVSGLYVVKKDQNEAFWLGWFCVDPEYRGKGIGNLLLDFSISESSRHGKKYLRLYTSTHPNEAKAQILYEHKGFRIVPERGRVRQKDYEVFYRELKLKQ